MRFAKSFKELGQPSSHKRKQVYDIKQVIGQGEFGQVKLAHNTETGEDVAIKVVPKSNYKNLEAQKHRLEKYGQLEHPNLMHLQEYFESKERYYFVLDYMPGGELYDLVEGQGNLQESVARDVTKQLLSCIEYLHSKDIVHRDIKLENILTSEDHKHVVIGDMGLSAQLQKPDAQLYAVCGSLGYQAPEIHDRNGYSRPVDLWSCGVVVFLMLGGRFPFLGADAASVAQEGREHKIRFTKKSPWTEVSETAKDLIRNLLQPDVSKRLTATEALQHPWFTTDLSAHKPSAGSSDGDHVEGEGVTRRLTEISAVSAKVSRTVTQEGPDDESSRMVV